MDVVETQNLDRRRFFCRLKQSFLYVLISAFLFLISPCHAQAQLQETKTEDGIESLRSLESLRDLEYETWQVVVYNSPLYPEKVIIRVVGYPATLRLDHPIPLKVHSGRRDWELDDITLANSELANDPRDAAAEFELTPLLSDLTNNRPLRLKLPGAFSELPIPPYLVSEWRSLHQPEEIINERN